MIAGPLDSVRLIGLAVATAVAIGGVAWGYQHVKGIGDAEARAELQPKLDAAVVKLANAEVRLAEAEADRTKAEGASRGYQDELAAIRDAPVRRDPVRLCVQSSPRAATGAAQAPATAGLSGSATATGLVSGGTGEDSVSGPDIGPELRALLRRADEVSGQARGLQSYCTDP
jgi:hypothetical protein